MTEMSHIPVDIEDEMKKSYLDYAMSVIVGRALPNVRDGLKPVHRRILFAMFREGLLSSRRYSKCAGVVGEVLKKYHPHGDMAVYDSLVRLAQDFNMRYPLIDGQGNFGSVDGDPAAAYRYTEARLMKIAEEMLEDIDRETVDFYPNFDESEMEPGVLPSKIPNLLVNGSSGIAVGMATNIPPHNMQEVIEGCIRFIDNPDITLDGLMKYIHGPDFPTYGFIYGVEGIKQAYKTGRGIIQVRARAITERGKKSDREKIVITEVPYMVNKARLVEQIADLVRNKKIEGIADLRDESDRDGIRIVLELRRGETANVVLNTLFKHTQMQTTFGIIMLALVDLQPKVLDLKSMIELFVSHRKEVVARRSVFELKKAKARAHILEGLQKAMDHIDAIIRLIKRAASPQEAKEALISRFSFSDAQAQSILEMRLQRLTALERDKIIQEHKELLKRIAYLEGILKDEKKLMKVIAEELEEIRKRYGDERRTEIIAKTEDISMEDLIVEEDMVVTCSHSGYIKRSPVTLYRKQRRGGKGRFGMKTREEDFVELLFVASTHDYFLVFTRKGRVHWLKVHQIPQIGVAGKGKAIVNLLNLESSEQVAALLRVKDFSDDQYIVMATRRGIIKKTSLPAFKNPRQGGIRALAIDDDDELHAVALTDGDQNVFLGTYLGKSIRFHDSDVRPMGRTARGVRGIYLSESDFLVGMKIIREHGTLLTITEKGFGKRSLLSQYRKQGRGGKGLINLKTTSRNGNVVGIASVTEEDEIILVTAHGKIIRTKVNSINPTGRSTQGVKLINLDTDDKVVAMAKLVEKQEEEIEEAPEKEKATEG